MNGLGPEGGDAIPGDHEQKTHHQDDAEGQRPAEGPERRFADGGNVGSVLADGARRFGGRGGRRFSVEGRRLRHDRLPVRLQLEGALAEALPDDFGKGIDDEGHAEQREHRQEQHPV